MVEQIQDLEDYIKYQFDELPSFKLALFLDSENQLKVKFQMGTLEENFITDLLHAVKDSPTKVHLENSEFSQKPSEKTKVYTNSGESRIFVRKSENGNQFLVYSSGKTGERDEKRIVELVDNLMD